ncbi:heparinase II/III-family protein [Microbacterium lacus]|uniref:heparinase II/III domain-containing protein n=1 Tax=Microbacterium lacus TaxID=415217 RepID=UPI00384B95D8
MNTTFPGTLSDAFGRRSSTRELGALLRIADESLPVEPATNRGVWGSVDAGELLSRAAHDLRAPWPIPLASAAARVYRDGDRDGWEQVAYERQYRLSRAAIAAAVTLDEMWIDEVIDGIQLLCEQSSWCWPAHDDTFERHGAVLATVTDPFLDLGAGEVVGQLAWIDHVLGAGLDARAPGIRQRIRHEARLRVFDPFVARRDWHWIGLDGDVHNWNPWIHGNVLVAALRLLDAPDDVAVRAAIVALSVEGLDRYVTVLPADGAIDEGYSYWWNGACRALEALDILSYATGGALDATPKVTALRETVAFPHRSHLGRDWYLNLADGQARPSCDQPWHALYRAAQRAGDQDAAAHAAAHRDVTPNETAGFGRLVRALTDRDWVEASVVLSPLPRDVWLPSTEVMLARETAGSSDGLALAIKGGHNGEHHNHNDVGSFVVASDGVPVLVDVGRPTYTKATFGPDRYDIWTMQSSWHNVPEVGGIPQGVGAEFAARDARVTVTDAASTLSLDIADAYPVDALRAWRRTATLDRERGTVRVEDAWDLDSLGAGSEPLTTVRLLVAGEVRLAPDSAGIVPLDGAHPVIVRWPGTIQARIVQRELDDPMLSDVWGARLTRIDLDVTSAREVWITVEKDTSTLARRATTRDQQ